MRVLISKEGETLILKRTRSKYVLELVAYLSLFLALFAWLTFITYKGYSEFEPVVKMLFPLLFLTPFYFLQKIRHLFPIVMNEQEIRIEKSGQVEIRSGQKKFHYKLQQVKIETELSGDGGPDVFKVVGILDNGRRWIIEESLAPAESNRILESISHQIN